MKITLTDFLTLRMFLRIVLFSCSLSITFGITYPPSFTQMPPKNKVFIPGEAILLPCVAIGAPSPRYTWYKNGKEFNFAANTGRYTKWPDQGTLVIARPGTDDDGMYQCVAVNQFGVALSVVINVRRAELGEFTVTKVTYLSSAPGKSLILPCHVPVGYPEPVVTWQTEKNSEIQYLKETNRRATDINGYLYIATVTTDDHNTLYTCVANNEVLRVQRSGPSYRISVLGQQLTVPLEILYRSPRTEVAVVGDVLRLICIFGGSPEPQYSWFKNENETITLPNVQMKNLGTMLEINPVTLEAAGQYRCQGTNEVTIATANVQYTVHVRVRPTFIEKPEDITVPINGSVTFRCTATGDPPPQIRWTVNGQDTSTYIDGVRKVLLGNVMQLTNLTINDTAVIQCNASNAFGYDFTNAYVNVMREPPYFIKPPKKELRAVEGSEVILFCQTFSAPKAMISWSKDGRPINGGRYQSLSTGDLRIASVAITDSGVYECTATNPFGSQKASGKLLIRRKTSIVLAPINTRVYENDIVKFVCTAETDPAELENLKITWYKDDNYIDSHLTPRIKQVKFDYALVLSGAEPRDTGQYRCNASNGLDTATATAPLLVQGRPEQAINVQVNCVEFIDEELALVSWYPGSDNYSPIMEYMVEYSTQFERETWYPAEIFNMTGLVQSTSVKVVLRPNIQYLFRVRTRNRVGVSLPSAPTTQICGIPGRVPSVNPKELYVFGSLRNNLIIRWTTLPYIEHYANNLGYIINVECLDCDFIPKGAVNTSVIGDWRIDRITYTSFRVGVNVYEMETYKMFRVSIQSRNEKGVCIKPPTVAFGYSGEAVPTIVPVAPKLISATSQGANLQWKVIEATEEKSVNGFFRGYRVEWCDANLDGATCTKQMRFQDVILRIPTAPVLYVNRRRRSADPVEICKLHDSNPYQDIYHEQETILERYSAPSTKIYYRWLTGQSDPKGISSTSEICRSTPKRNISCPGAGLFPRAIQSPSIMGDAYSALLSRKPRQTDYTGLQAMNQLTKLQFQWGMILNFTLTDVPGALAIKVWLRILNNRFAGPASSSIQFTTLEGLPGPVSNLRAEIVSVNYVDISWRVPNEPNGKVIGYEFEATEINGLDVGFGFRYPSLLNGSATNYRLARLKPNKTYRITVWPTTSAGSGVDNFIELTTAPSDQAPNPPTFVITHVGETEFTVLYEPSHIGLPGTVFFVQYRQPGIVHWLESIPTFLNRTIVIQSLLPDTVYTVRMVATNGALMSSVSEDRQVNTLGGPVPGGLAGSSGIWFILVCTLLLFFMAVLILLILIRQKRIEEVQKKANAPLFESEKYLLTPEYAQPDNHDARPIYPIGIQIPKYVHEDPLSQSANQSENDENEDQWSQDETEDFEFNTNQQRKQTVSSPVDDPLRYTREMKSEIEHSPVASDQELSYSASVRSQSPPLKSNRKYRQYTQQSTKQSKHSKPGPSTRRSNNPSDMSDYSQIAGDPTVI